MHTDNSRHDALDPWLRHHLQRCKGAFRRFTLENLTLGTFCEILQPSKQNRLNDKAQQRKHMSNTQASESTTVTVKTTPKLVKAVKEIVNAQGVLEGKFQSGADACREAATSLGYDRKQASEMLKLAYTEAGQDISRKAPDISKILSLAYPASDEAATNLADAKAHNAKAPAAEKIGVNDQLKIARDKEGKTTVETILAERKAKADAKRGAQNGGAPRVGTASTPATLSKEDAQKALTSLYTQMRVTAKMSEEECEDMWAEIVTEFNDALEAPKK